MPLSSDFHDILEVFVYTNLPLLMNPFAAANTFTTTVAPIPGTTATVPGGTAIPVSGTTAVPGTTATVPGTTTTTTVPGTTATSVLTPITLAITTAAPAVPAKVFTPDVLVLLQAAVFNNFTGLGLRSDIQELARVFFANLPAAPPAITPITPTTPTLPNTSTTPTIPITTNATPTVATAVLSATGGIAVTASPILPVAPVTRTYPPDQQATPPGDPRPPLQKNSLTPDILAALQTFLP